MKDKNGIEIKTGAIVKISGAYFKNDNGLYYVERSPGDPAWCGKEHSLRKISKTGKISTASRNIGFWPIFVAVSDRYKGAEARSWNREHAEIEIVQIANMGEVKAHFKQEAAALDKLIQRDAWEFGETSPRVMQNLALRAHYEAVAAAI